MGVGPNYVLDKGMKATGTIDIVAGHFVKLTTNPQEVAVTAAITDKVIGVTMENVDAAKVTQGKVFMEVRLMGVARVEAAAAIAIGAKVAPESAATARAQTAVSTQFPAGIALTAASAAGDYIDVLLTPGMPVLP
jgi:hypothetical protein